MSAPTTNDPLTVNTRDGVCWERRAVTDSGLGLYAVEGSCKCPPFKMATLAELAERGITGTADVLPLPVGPEPQAMSEARELAAFRSLELGDLDGRVSASCGNPSHPTWLRARIDPRGCPWCEIDQAHEDVIGANLARYEEEQENARLRARVAELETGPALPWAHTMPDDDLSGFLNDLVSAAVNRWQSSPEVPDRETLAAVEKACAAWRTPGQGYRSDEDEPAEVPVPQTERSRWVAIAEALNAAHDAGMPVGIDLDGTLTDHCAWSVVWDRTAERWTVAGYEDEDGCACPPADRPHQVGCPLDGVPSDAVSDATPLFPTVGWLREPEGEHYASVHHEYRPGLGRDLPETGGAS